MFHPLSVSSMDDHPLSILGEPEIKTVQPFTKVDLSQIPFYEIIRNFQILEAENVPENPLLYLYPNTLKDEAFGKYYTDKSGGERSVSVLLILFACHFKDFWNSLPKAHLTCLLLNGVLLCSCH